MKNIIIFGATGNIGTYLVEHLQKKLDKHEFNVITVGKSEGGSFLSLPYYGIDITDNNQFLKLPSENIFAIYHLAGLLQTSKKNISFEEMYSVNVTGTYNIMQYAIKSKAERLIYTQSIQDIISNIKEGEIVPSEPALLKKYVGEFGDYAFTKKVAEEIIRHLSNLYDICDYYVRLPLVYNYSNNPYYYKNGVKIMRPYNHFINKAILGQEIELWGDTRKFYDYVYVKDLCQLLEKILYTDKKTGFYNAGMGKGFTLLEHLNSIIENFCENKKSKIIFRPEKPSAKSYILSIESARRDLNYNPIYSPAIMYEDMKFEKNRRKNEKQKNKYC